MRNFIAASAFFVDFCPRAFAYSAPRCYNGSGVNTDEKQLNTVPRMHYVAAFLRNNIVLVVALVAAAVSCCFVPPDGEYVGYFDLRTLSSLFGMSAVITAMKRQNVFRALADKLIKRFRTTRSLVAALVAITYLASMLIANDMALLTFLPLGYCALHAAGKEDKMAYTFTLQTVAANLGGMLTPFGNPQNLYLYNRFSIPTGEFFRIMIFPTLAAVAAIALLCLFVKREPIEPHADEVAPPDKAKTAVYLVAFAYMIVVVFRVVPYWTAFLVIPLLLVLDRGALAHADYSLLLTFCAFFVFTGNLARISAVDAFFRFLLGKSVLLTGVLCCQAISNVPSAVLLSGFTSDYARLLVAVNIGGCGTLISSMASVISFRNFSLYRPGERLKYLGINAAVNFMCLVVLTLFCLFVPIYP